MLGLSSRLEYAYQLKNDFKKLGVAPNSIVGRKLLLTEFYPGLE